MNRWILAAACGVAALGLMLYPLAGELVSEKYHSDVETTYTAAIEDNRLYYRRRAEEEGNPAIRALLAQDRRHLDDVQTMMASSRQFCFVLRRRKTDGAINLATVEQRLRDSGFTVRRVEGTELLELLAIYFEQDATHEVFDLVDGARWLTAEMEEENADFES